jgi:hypothetical protein
VIHVVVSCTERKSLPPLPSLRASQLTRDSFRHRLESWVTNLASAASALRVAELYQGEHWSVAREIVAEPHAKVLVASAGYGLLDVESFIAPYAATFVSGQPDSITLATSSAEMDAQRRLWWCELRERAPQQERRSLAALAADGPLLVAASRPYLAAMAEELIEADNASPGHVVLTTTGDVPAGLRHLRTAATGALRTLLGGSMQAVSVRLAAHIVRKVPEGKLTHASANALTERLMADASPLERHSRSPLTDDDVLAYIVSAMSDATPPSCSALLRTMRDEGLACEQKRFRRLYDETRRAW